MHTTVQSMPRGILPGRLVHVHRRMNVWTTITRAMTAKTALIWPLDLNANVKQDMFVIQGALLFEYGHAKRSLMAWVGVIPKFRAHPYFVIKPNLQKKKKKSKKSAATQAHPSFGMTTTQDIRDLFAQHSPFYYEQCHDKTHLDIFVVVIPCRSIATTSTT